MNPILLLLLPGLGLALGTDEGAQQLRDRDPELAPALVEPREATARGRRRAGSWKVEK